MRVQSGVFAGQQRISKPGRGLLRWALYQAAGRARLAALEAKRLGYLFASYKAMVKLAAKQLRLVWSVWRSGTPYDPTRAGWSRRHG